ncbi:hypothetical protein BCV70DRAFT_114304 [Testicularia cyperi]|uniref:Uncharacterized protein n=1 Tax=Testicularia cyperi TaxID=1882483 RepID=A0A317XNN5_9BASI|nr:hypothetical protein BCV70DRAFT_114304 [Testicularia cyperi]
MKTSGFFEPPPRLEEVMLNRARQFYICVCTACFSDSMLDQPLERMYWIPAFCFVCFSSSLFLLHAQIQPTIMLSAIPQLTYRKRAPSHRKAQLQSDHTCNRNQVAMHNDVT